MVGGNGGTGAEVVRQARAAGHDVTCVSRGGAASLPEGVRNLVGDALSPAVAREAVTGADAVVVTVGGSAGAGRHRTDVTRSLVAAMQEAGVRRLVVQSSLGVGDSLTLLPAPLRLVVRAALGRALADHADQEAVVTASGLDWTVVRPGGLADGPATGVVVAQETAEHRPMKGRIARADVAAYILGVLDDPASFGRAVALGTP